MAASDTLSPPQFTDQLTHHLGGNGIVVAEHPEHGNVGKMTWDPNSGEIENINVDPQFQHRGVATSMWKHARAHAAVPPEHSAHRTPEGNAWAKKMAKADGEALPRLKRVDY